MSQNQLLFHDHPVYSSNRPFLAEASTALNTQTWRPSSWTSKLAGFWCELMHGSTTWPIHGRYHCRQCDRVYAVPWK